MSAERVVLVGDAHLGSAGPGDEEAFHEFLSAVPSFGTSLLLLGDVFGFWFEYRAVIPRRPFRTLARLAALTDAGVPVTYLGGNHDRWGGGFWTRDLGIRFHPGSTELELAGRRAWVVHGDGLTDHQLGARVLQWVTRSPVAIAAFRALHPDLGYWIADRLSAHLGEDNRTGEAARAAAAAQERFALRMLEGRPELDLAVFGHTHERRLAEAGPSRFYLNPGPWMHERQYALVTAERIELLTWPARPVA